MTYSKEKAKSSIGNRAELILVYDDYTRRLLLLPTKIEVLFENGIKNGGLETSNSLEVDIEQTSMQIGFSQIDIANTMLVQIQNNIYS